MDINPPCRDSGAQRLRPFITNFLVLIGITLVLAALALHAHASEKTARQQIEDLLNNKASLMGLIISHHPELAAPTRDRLLAAWNEGGEQAVEEAASRLSEQYGTALLAQYAPAADGDALKELLEGFTAAILKVREASPTACYEWLFGNEHVDLAVYGVSQSLLTSLNKSIVKVIRTGAEGDKAAVTEADLKLMDGVTSRAIAQVPDPDVWQALASQSPASSPELKAGICNAIAALYTEMGKLDEEQREKAARLMFGSG